MCRKENIYYQGTMKPTPYMGLKQISCFSVRNTHPYGILGPFKVEILSHDPLRYILHDILSEMEILTMIKKFKGKLTYDTSLPLLVNTLTSNSDVLGGKAATIRFSHLFYNQSNLVKSTNMTPIYIDKTTKAHNNTLYERTTTPQNMAHTISKRLETITLLNLTEYRSKSQYRISMHGLGSMVESHDDSYQVEGSPETLNTKYSYRKMYGDIMATVLIWLTDVDEGGGTYFSSYGFEQVVMPTKGAALIWINVKASGGASSLQEHGGCPVAKGKKLVLGVWVDHYNQYNNFPCQLEKDSKIVFPLIFPGQ